ncbi:MAG: ZIP family metal transporter [bacterium]|nr:ZIP family metal transporter [bacterium]
MTEYLQLIGLALAGGVVSLIAGALLLSRQKTAEALARYATPFAAGALLGAVFLDLLKEGIELGDSNSVLMAALVGMLIFFFAERFLRWFHHHHEEEDESSTIPLIIAGDTAHNALDGVAIAAAFLISPATGVITALAVAAHEIPQEIGDFGLLLSKGMRRRKVLIVNIVSALATVLFAVITYAVGDSQALPIDVLLGLSAGFLLYIAASDIIPSIHDSAPNKKQFDWQSVLLILGVLVVGFSVNLAHKYIDDSHEDSGSHEQVDHSADKLHQESEHHEEENYEDELDH